MIYLDNSATSYPKPKNLIDCLAQSVDIFGSSSRGIYDISINSNKMIYATRAKISKLFGCEDALAVAFTSNATESLNLVINSLFNSEDHIITTVWEHNSVMRPLYNNKIGFDVLELEDNYSFDYSKLKNMLKKNTKAVICSHSSNILGNLIDVDQISNFCKENGLIFILDVAQTGGLINIDMVNNGIDIVCFTGHKSLYGISGTGGICVNPNSKLVFKSTKTGGSGGNSLCLLHSKTMPECFEAGTSNFIGINALSKGIDFVNEIGVENILKHEVELMNKLYNLIKEIKGVKIFGNFETERTPILSFVFNGIDANDIASILWEKYEIAVRGGFHCCPLLHKNIGSEKTGLVRFSFSYFNSIEQVLQAGFAVNEICKIK